MRACSLKLKNTRLRARLYARLAPTGRNLEKTIPNDLELTEAEKSVLRKGLSFVPVKPKAEEFTTREDCEKYFRQLRLRAFFHDNQHTDNGTPPSDTTDNETSPPGPTDNVTQPSDHCEETIFSQLKPKRSKWIPPSGSFPALDHYIDRCRAEIDQIDFSSPVKRQNLSREELLTLRSLRNRSDIVIKPADKGGAIVVWRRDLYEQEALKQLGEDRFYKPVDSNKQPPRGD